MGPGASSKSPSRDAFPVVLAFGGPGPAPPHAFLGSWPQVEHHVKNLSDPEIKLKYLKYLVSLYHLEEGARAR